jgi:hypothetical protein
MGSDQDQHFQDPQEAARDFLHRCAVRLDEALACLQADWPVLVRPTIKEVPNDCQRKLMASLTQLEVNSSVDWIEGSGDAVIRDRFQL